MLNCIGDRILILVLPVTLMCVYTGTCVARALYTQYFAEFGEKNRGILLAKPKLRRNPAMIEIRS